MLGYVYWHSATHTGYEIAFNAATLGGCILGMILFGFLADHFGRRKLYGIALLVLIVGTFGVVTSSVGFTPIRHDFEGDYEIVDWKTRGSMDIVDWLLFWRFVSGVGLGGDYVSRSITFPAVNVLTSEAPDCFHRCRICADHQERSPTRCSFLHASHRHRLRKCDYADRRVGSKTPSAYP